MRILVLNGSPRPKGNTKQMVDAFREGAESAGHKADVAKTTFIELFCHSIIFLHRNIQVTIFVRTISRFEETIIFNDWQCVIAISVAEFRGNSLSNPMVWRNAARPRFVSEYSCGFITHSYP